jgi:hypothetical protein
LFVSVFSAEESLTSLPALDIPKIAESVREWTIRDD